MTANANGIDWRRRAPNLALGGLLSLAVILGAAKLSAWPTWQSLPEGTAVLRLSFSHPGIRKCRDRTAAELAGLPKNMRSAKICESRRAPVRVEMDIDGRRAFAADLAPSGLAGSGPSRVYHRFALPVGTYRVDVRLSDNPEVAGFPHKATFDITAASARSYVIDFDGETGEFFLH
jgi:hypothetical protein